MGNLLVQSYPDSTVCARVNIFLTVVTEKYNYNIKLHIGLNVKTTRFRKGVTKGKNTSKLSTKMAKQPLIKVCNKKGLRENIWTGSDS